MATTLTWTINWMKASTQEINGHAEVVLDAGWTLTGTNGDYTASAYNTVSFPQPEAGGAYTPYADLTEEQVLGWVWQNGVDKDAAEFSVTGQVELLINPVVVTPPLPWAS